jgi:hypothetical protein
LRFDGAQRLGSDYTTTSRYPGLAGLGQRARVKLDHPLQLMNPDRAEALTPERISQSHIARLPADVHP